jgi:PAT family beta-lactamase induction signal transducer AmpG
VSGALERLRQSLGAYAYPPVRAMLLLGFAAGLPFPLVLTTLSARLRQAGIDRTTIGYFSLVGLAYSLKFCWSPIVDRVALPLLSTLGRRRSWMLLAQLCILLGLGLLALVDPAVSAEHVAWLAVFTAFGSATQDIALDAYRIERADEEWQGAMVAAYQVGYQLALIAAGAGALHAAATDGWTWSYGVMAACFLIGPITTVCIAEPQVATRAAGLPQDALVQRFLAWAAPWPRAARQSVAWLVAALVCPFVDFVRRLGWRAALPVLLLIVTYRLNYMTMGVAANTFYIDLGFTLDQIALVSKMYGVAMTMLGALLAGVLVKRHGILPTLLLGCALLSVANLVYAHLATLHPGLAWLATAVSADNVANGIAGTAFIAYLSSLTSSGYTATQYALFGTLWSLPAKSLASQWGRIVDAWGYGPFFVYTALLGLPAILLILWLMRRRGLAPSDSASTPAQPSAES